MTNAGARTPDARPPRTLATGGGDATASGVNFQQSVGARLLQWMLTESFVDRRLGLGAAKVTSVRFETEAPLDDVLARTCEAGVLAVQAKNTLSLSDDPASEFGRTVEQIVRQWRLSRDGVGDLEWNRPLDAAKDRLVIAVGPDSPATTRVHLAKALEARRQPGPPVLTRAEEKALSQFDACVRHAWAEAAGETATDATLRSIRELTYVYVVDASGPERAATVAALESSFVDGPAAASGLDLLERVAGDLMASRGGHTLAMLRADLFSRGARLSGRADYRRDIAALQEATRQTERVLAAFEVIEAETGACVTLARDCQPAVDAAALGGHLLLIGEPGAGKSAVLSALGRTLRGQGHDVVSLAVDRFSVESLEGVSGQLGLTHDLPSVLQAWDGKQQAFLLIDALDAGRGGGAEAAFKRLIESVVEAAGRWTVVASIRSFDLRLGVSFRTLFKGAPADSALQSAEFPQVRHLQVPPWSPAEFGTLLSRAPRLAEVLREAPAKLLEVARVPFNTRLLAELVATGTVKQDLSAVGSQSALLDLYWERRIERQGLAAEVCLRAVVDRMVARRTLRAPKLEVAAHNPGALEALIGVGVLVLTDAGRSIQFRHHLLFDYVASRVFLDGEAVAGGEARFPKADGLGLILAPAFGFMLRGLWSQDVDHGRFWTAVANLAAQSDGDAVIRSLAARTAAELPESKEDVDAFARAVIEGLPCATAALPQVAGALAVRLEDEPAAPLAPWVRLELQLSASPKEVVGIARMLAYLLVDRVRDPELRADLGRASRALLAYGFTLDDSGKLATPAIGFVIDTLSTDVDASTGLLREVFSDARFARFGPQEFPALARKIETISAAAPDFAREIYAATFAREVTEDRRTSLGGSRILNLTSNVRQEFESARWSLKEHFPVFLAASPIEATTALLAALDGYVARQHPIAGRPAERVIQTASGPARLQPDASHIWAHEAHPSHAQDGDALLSQFETWLETGEEGSVLAAVTHAVAHVSLAVIWSRLFMAGAARGGALARMLRPQVLRPEFLIAPDTRKGAIDLLASDYDQLSEPERVEVETALLAHGFEEFVTPERAKEGCLWSVFGAIGAERLATADARVFLATAPAGEARNARLFSIQISSVSDDYYWLEPTVRRAPVVQDAIRLVERVQQALQLEVNEAEPVGSLADALEALSALKGRLDAGDTPDEALARRMEGVFAQGLHKVVRSGDIDESTPSETLGRLLSWIEDASRYANPEVSADSEADFERGPSWSSPSARLEAAKAALRLCAKRPQVYPSLEPLIDRLLVDPHPAVRMNAALRLVRIWDVDWEGFWRRAEAVVTTEHNRGVLDGFVAGVLSPVAASGEARRIADLVLPLLERCGPNDARSEQLRRHLVQMLLQFWWRDGLPDAEARVRSWFAAAVENAEEVREIIVLLRNDYTDGLRGEHGSSASVQRATAIELLAQAVKQASEVVGGYAELSSPDEAQTTRARTAMQILATACQQLYFSSGAFRHGDDVRTPLTQDGAATLLHENADTLKIIGAHGDPHTVFHLVQLLEHLVEADPPAVFDLIAWAILRGGRQSGFEFEVLGADLVVKLVGRFLADHKEVFDDEARRTALVDSLEVFTTAGWPAARRLFYRLPDLLQ